MGLARVCLSSLPWLVEASGSSRGMGVEVERAKYCVHKLALAVPKADSEPASLQGSAHSSPHIADVGTKPLNKHSAEDVPNREQTPSSIASQSLLQKQSASFPDTIEVGQLPQQQMAEPSGLPPRRVH